jgi:copper(I)-binding protein
MLAALLAWTVVAGAAGAHEFRLGELTIEHPYAIATPPAAKAGAGYLTIRNAGAEADRLVAVEAPFPMVQVHATETDASGVARMAPVEALEVPPGATVTLAPGGTHVMFMGLAEPLTAGDTLDAALVFEKAGRVEVQFNVEARAEAPMQEDHADH